MVSGLAALLVYLYFSSLRRVEKRSDSAAMAVRCGAAPMRRLTGENVRRMPSGFSVSGYSEIVPYWRAMRSPDEYYYGFWRDAEMICFFAPSDR